MIMGYYASGTTASGGFESVFPNSPVNTSQLHNIQIPAGYENLFVNLASDLFSQPHGELIVMKDTDNDIIGAFYLEQSYIPSHSLAVDAQGIIWQEAVQIQFERLMPIKLTTAIPLYKPRWDQNVTSADIFNTISTNIGQGIGTDSTQRLESNSRSAF
jgi:hypothetical protein